MSSASKSPSARKLFAVALAASMLVLAACSKSSSGTDGKKVIKIAFLAPKTGTAAATGMDMMNGWKIWWDKNGDTVAGTKVETIYYDTASDPNTALTKARQAVEQDKVSMIVGPYLANEGTAVASYTTQAKVPLFMPTASADDLTQRKRDPYLVRVGGWTSSQTTHPAGDWAYKKGYRKVVTIANAYAFGYENAGGFAQVFTESGGKILKQLWAPLGTADYSPYLSQLNSLQPDAVFVEMVGADVRAFLEAWQSFGFKGKIPLIGNETLTDQSNIRKIKVDASVDIMTFGHWAEGRDNPVTKTFVEEFSKAYKAYPSYPATGSFINGQWITEAIKAMNGDISNKDKFIEAVKNVKLAETPFGPLSMDKYGNPIFNVYIRKTVAAPNSEYATVWNVVTETIPNVSQFWTYDPETYLKQPVYTDQFQGIKNN